MIEEEEKDLMLNYAQQNVLRYIFSKPGSNIEAITNALAGYNNSSARWEIASAVGHLVWKTPYVRMDERTQAIYITDSGNAALESV